MLWLFPVFITMMDILCDFFCEGRAIMVEPPHRSSLWRFRYPTNINTEDDLLNCGGFAVQWEQNKGRCGICGDPAFGPFDHEDNGHFASGIIVRSYDQGGSVNVTVEVLSNLLGYFEFRLCPRNSTKQRLTHDCFEQNPLWIEESWGTRFYVGSRGGIYDLHVKLPSNIVCTQCVFQWKYSTGYRMGGINTCECMGCGHQEQFYNCADVEIRSGKTSKDPPFGFMPPKQNPSFLFSPENQSYIVLQRLREQLPVFPWPNGLQIPHNMMFPARQRQREKIENGEINGDHSILERLFLSEFNLPLVGPIGQSLGMFPRFPWPVRFPSNTNTSILVPKTPSPLLTMSNVSVVSVNESKKSSFPSYKQTTALPTSRTPMLHYVDRSKWNFTDRLSTTRKPTLLTSTSPIPKRQTSVKGRLYGDSVIFPLFNQSNIIKPTIEKKPVPVRPKCDKTSPMFHCKGRGFYSKTKNIRKWCTLNCRAGNCQKHMCLCGCGRLTEVVDKCHAIGSFAAIHGMDEWCRSVCSKHKCPTNICNVKTCQ